MRAIINIEMGSERIPLILTLAEGMSYITHVYTMVKSLQVFSFPLTFRWGEGWKSQTIKFCKNLQRKEG